MARRFQDKQLPWGSVRHDPLPRLPYCYARSALFVDPMLLTPAVAVAIAIAIPIGAGKAGCGGTALIR